MLKRLVLVIFITALGVTQARADPEADWQLRIKRAANGWTASFSGAQSYGDSRGGPRLKGSGVRVEKARAVAAFSQVRVDGPIDVVLSQAAADGVKVTADDNIEPLIEAAVEGDTLVLRLQRGAGFTTRHTPQVRIDSKNLQALMMSGSGDVQLDRFKGERLSLSMSGSGDLRLGMVEVRELSVAMQGSGDVQVAGRADTQSWVMRGSGDVDARSLSGRAVKAQLDGSGDMALGVSETLDVDLRGSGDLSYAGRPQLRQSSSGSGEVSHR
jgi:hypothetical protein